MESIERLQSGPWVKSATYDPAGDLACLGTLGTLKYDGYERLETIKNKAGDRYVHNAYNAFNARTYKDSHGQMTRFVYGQNQELLVEQAAGGPEQDYVYLDGKLMARLDSTAGGAPTVFYFHTDALGTPQAVTDATREIVWRARYAPFGQATVVQQGVVNHLRFPGQYFDQETQLAYNVHRYYDATTGRYLQADPVGLTTGVNLYTYAESNPLSFADPYGLFGWVDMPTLPQGLVDFSAGLGDALLLGAGGYLRDLADVGAVDPCSMAYEAGAWASLGLGVGRVAYAAGAKAGAALAASGVEASAFRLRLKGIFRFGAAKNWRAPDLTKYPTDDALRAAAGRTNSRMNAYGAGVTAAGATGAINGCLESCGRDR